MTSLVAEAGARAAVAAPRAGRSAAAAASTECGRSWPPAFWPACSAASVRLQPAPTRCRATRSYGLKRGIESAELKLAHSDLSRGRELLDQADHRLSEAETLAAAEDARSPETLARIDSTITDLDAATRAGAGQLNAAYADTGDVEPLVELQRFVADQRERLADLSALLEPGRRRMLAPLSQLLVALQARLDAVIDGSSAAPAAGPTGTATAAPGQGGTGVTGTIGGVTGGGTSPTVPGGGVGGAGDPGAAASSLPSPLPHVSVSAPTVPRVHVPSAPVPIPTVVPTLPVHVTPPVCVPVPPLTDC